jgi:hypothetical protein
LSAQLSERVQKISYGSPEPGKRIFRSTPVEPRIVEELLKFNSGFHRVTSEFGRSPKINENAGRDHWARVYSQVLAGGGIRI